MDTTNALAEIIANFHKTSTPEQFNTFRKAVEFSVNYYRERFQHDLRTHGDIPGLMLGYYEHVDKLLQERIAADQNEHPLSCRKGCAHCCKVRVDISINEGLLILAYCQQEGIEIDYEYLKGQENYEIPDYAGMPNRSCVFLDDNNACKIYEARPLACRKYLVVSEPQKCDTTTYKGGWVKKMLDTRVECLASAFADRDGGSIPQILLKLKHHQ